MQPSCRDREPAARRRFHLLAYEHQVQVISVISTARARTGQKIANDHPAREHPTSNACGSLFSLVCGRLSTDRLWCPNRSHIGDRFMGQRPCSSASSVWRLKPDDWLPTLNRLLGDEIDLQLASSEKQALAPGRRTKRSAAAVQRVTSLIGGARLIDYTNPSIFNNVPDSLGATKKKLRIIPSPRKRLRHDPTAILRGASFADSK